MKSEKRKVKIKMLALSQLNYTSELEKICSKIFKMKLISIAQITCKKYIHNINETKKY